MTAAMAGALARRHVNSLALLLLGPPVAVGFFLIVLSLIDDDRYERLIREAVRSNLARRCSGLSPRS